VIATGGRPAIPPVPGLAEAEPLTNETVWALTERPDHLVVIGAGPIGCELAQSFARFGSRVTLLDQVERILPNDDPDAARVVAQALENDGVRFVGGAAIGRVERQGARSVVHFEVGGAAESIEAGALLVAAGRRPNVEGLELERARVAYDKKGITTDERLRTSNEAIYAVGDVTATLQFTHTADAHARMVVRNALFFGRGNKDDLIIPWCTYTSPELAHVGITSQQVAERGDAVNTITISLADVDRAVLDGETDGFFRVHLDGDSDRILGATMVAEHAGDIISQITQAMTTGTGLGKLGETIFPYPTRAEAIRKAADAWRRTRLTPLAKSVFDSYFGFLS
jgi:pyruvate/2-oxoglutarate dehydrogenase complex dihydrolipoamide dehydrogenase (E3) component